MTGITEAPVSPDDPLNARRRAAAAAMLAQQQPEISTVQQAAPRAPLTPHGLGMHDLVVKDMIERREFGRLKYGTELKAFNGRRALVDAYQELLDQAVYLRQELAEREVLEAEILKLRSTGGQLLRELADARAYIKRLEGELRTALQNAKPSA